MKKIIIASLCIITISVTLIGVTQEKKTSEAQKTQIKGEVVDLGCFTSREARGEEHKSCATRCLQNGNPAAVIDDQGNVYTIAASSLKYAPFASQKVRLTGLLRSMAIRPESMTVQKAGKWEEVELSSGAPKEH